MSRTCFVVDSGINPPVPDVLLREGIIVVDLHLIIKGKSYNTSELTPEQLAAMSGDAWPTTSGPSVGEFITAFSQAVSKGYKQILCLLISGGLSGTYSTAVQAANIFADMDEGKDIQIVVVDTKTAALGIGFVLERLLELEEKGMTFKEIVEMAEILCSKVKTYLVFDSLKWLVLGGRASKFQGFAVQKFIKLIMTLDEQGKFALLRMVRGAKGQVMDKAVGELVRILTLHGKRYARVGVLHVGNADWAESVRKRISEALGMHPEDIPMVHVCMPIYVHTGPKESRNIAVVVLEE